MILQLQHYLMVHGDYIFYLYDPFQTTSTSGFTDTHWDSIIFDKVYINADGQRSEIFEKV